MLFILRWAVFIFLCVYACVSDFLGQGVQPDARSPPHTVQDGGYASTQPVRKEDDPELGKLSGLCCGMVLGLKANKGHKKCYLYGWMGGLSMHN